MQTPFFLIQSGYNAAVADLEELEDDYLYCENAKERTELYERLSDQKRIVEEWEAMLKFYEKEDAYTKYNI